MSEKCDAHRCGSPADVHDRLGGRFCTGHSYLAKRGLLSQNTEPIKLVDAAVRDVWFPQPQRPRCQHEDGRGECRSRETTSHWNGTYVEVYCERHANEFTG